jgi:hypothetical protein
MDKLLLIWPQNYLNHGGAIVDLASKPFDLRLFLIWLKNSMKHGHALVDFIKKTFDLKLFLLILLKKLQEDSGYPDVDLA